MLDWTWRLVIEIGCLGNIHQKLQIFDQTFFKKKMKPNLATDTFAFFTIKWIEKVICCTIIPSLVPLLLSGSACCSSGNEIMLNAAFSEIACVLYFQPSRQTCQTNKINWKADGRIQAMLPKKTANHVLIPCINVRNNDKPTVILLASHFFADSLNRLSNSATAFPSRHCFLNWLILKCASLYSPRSATPWWNAYFLKNLVKRVIHFAESSTFHEFLNKIKLPVGKCGYFKCCSHGLIKQMNLVVFWIFVSVHQQHWIEFERDLFNFDMDGSSQFG